MADAAQLRSQAARCRRLAAAVHDARAEAELLKLASDYEAEAARLEGPGEPPAPPKPPNPMPG